MHALVPVTIITGMRVEIEGDEFEINVHNALFMRYAQLPILNGLFVDRDDDYVFVHADMDVYTRLYHPLREEGVHTSLISGEFDPTQMPHCWVIASVGRMLVQLAEDITENP